MYIVPFRLRAWWLVAGLILIRAQTRENEDKFGDGVLRDAACFKI